MANPFDMAGEQPAKIKSVFEKILPVISEIPKNSPNAVGRSRSRSFRSGQYGTVRTGYDLEISENPIRSPRIARELIEIAEYCPEAALAIELHSSDAFSSEDGDDQGFFLKDELPDGTTIDSDVYDVLNTFIKNVIGGRRLREFCEEFLAAGDAFGSIVLNKEKDGIERIMRLPTWEMFRCEDDQGVLTHFEQRRHYYDRQGIVIHPAL
jgi:hypothetical protein